MKTEKLAELLWAVERISGIWEMESQSRAAKWSEIGEDVRQEYVSRAKRFTFLRKMSNPAELDLQS